MNAVYHTEDRRAGRQRLPALNTFTKRLSSIPLTTCQAYASILAVT
ncbi:MAG: hypothetical protein RL681_335 [Candidatus Parcubacteria bacterium]|jgi:hypothetical protein